MTLAVEAGGRRTALAAGEDLTFGRDQTCGVCLDAADLGISRFAGRISHEGGFWVVTNLSRKRALHIIDQTGFAVPLPVAVDGIESRRAVDQPRMTVLVPGDSFTHALVLIPDKLPAPGAVPGSPADPLSTRTQRPHLTDRRREVVVAMAAGYLRPYPRYDPHPRTYQEVADLLGLSKSQVIKRVEDVREELVAAGVSGLQSELDARRPLCEWLLAMRLIGPADLDWLQPRVEAARARRQASANDTDAAQAAEHPHGHKRQQEDRPDSGAPPADARLPTTTHPIIDEITRIAERTARHIGPSLLARLRQHYGDEWLSGVNANRAPQAQARRQHLRDYRFCLSVLADDPATRGWIKEDCRRSARELNRIANMAAHRRTLTPTDIERARQYAQKITNGVPPIR
jgi:hypothetical protein